MRNLRMSRMSASAPAGIATRNMGSVVATCTSDTMSGSGLRLVISQPDAALYIELPTFAMTVAVQITANAGCRNGLKGEPTFAEEEERLALATRCARTWPWANRRPWVANTAVRYYCCHPNLIRPAPPLCSDVILGRDR